MLFYVLVSISFLILYFYYKSFIYLFIVFLISFVAFKKVKRKEFLIYLIFLISFALIRFNYYKTINVENENNKLYQVIDVRTNYLILRKDNIKYFVYTNNDLNVGKNDIIYSSSNIENIKDTYNDFYNYLNKERINYKLENNDYRLVKDNPCFSEEITSFLFKNRNDKARSYLSLILFNVKDMDNKNIFNNFTLLACTHLICISGFQITFLYKALEKLFSSLRMKKASFFLSSFIIYFYLVLLNFAVSVYRAFLNVVVRKIVKATKLSISKIEILCAIGIVFLFIKPEFIFSYSFLFSFLFTFFIEQISILKKRVKNKYKRELSISFSIYLVAIPIILTTSYELNFFTPFMTYLLIRPINYLFMFSCITLFLPFFDKVYIFIVDNLNNIMSFINSKSVTFVFGIPSIYFLIIYYLLLLLYFISMEKRDTKNKYLYLLGFLLVFKYCYPYLNSKEALTFLNIGQGDSIVFFIPHSKEVILVDAGSSPYKDMGEKKIIPYLKSKGIKAIDKIIITHDDYDHNGAVSSLIENYKVKEVIENSNNFKGLYIGDNYFKNLNMSNKKDNDGSVVLYGEYVGKKVLLTGDISSSIETKIINEQGDINVDILKVAHHGSKYSTSEEFLDVINARIAIISVGKNWYGHPSNDVLNRLEKRKIKYYRTDINNDIEIYQDIFNNFFINSG